MVQIEVEKKLNMADGWTKLSIKTEVKSGEFVVLSGKSGAGKTSLLRMISGLFKPDRGFVNSGNETWFHSEKKINIPVQKRNIGFVFQNLALFPNMTIKENLHYAAGKNQDKAYLAKLLQITELETMCNRKPQTLSGGQQQRVALIRALARKPKLLLLDEPFSSLDIPMRQQLQKELKAIHEEFQLTTILVSHDFSNLSDVADRLIEIKDGKNIDVKNFNSIPPTNALNERTLFEGKISKVYTSSIGFIAEIMIEDNILKIPVNKQIVNDLQIGLDVLLSIDSSGCIQMLSHDDIKV